MRTSLALICSLALALIFVAFVCAFATTASDHAVNLGELAQIKSTQSARPTDDVLVPLQPLAAPINPQIIKVAPLLEQLMRYAVFFFLVYFLISVPWPTTLLGVFLVLTALFFPSSAPPEASKGHFKLPFGIDVSFQGGLRLAAIVAGIVLIGGGLLEGGKGAKEASPLRSHYQKDKLTPKDAEWFGKMIYEAAGRSGTPPESPTPHN